MRKLLTSTTMVIALALLVSVAMTDVLLAANRITVECPVEKPVVDGDSIGVRIFIQNDDPLGGFSLGFSYDSDFIEISSVSQGPALDFGGSINFLTTIKPADNQVLTGLLNFNPALPFPAYATDTHLMTLWFQVPVGTPSHCVNIDSAFVPPAGPFVLSPQSGGSVTPDYVDCGEADISIAGGCDVVENTTPVVAGIPDESIPEGGSFSTITLDDYVTDAEDADADMSWTANSDNPDITVSIDGSRIATILHPGGEFSGTANIIFNATDPGGLSDSDTATFTVTPVNDPPVVAGIPDQGINEGETFDPITLDDYVTDAEDADADINWTANSDNPDITVSVDGSRVATVSHPGGQFNGSANIIFTATDTGAKSDADTATFTVEAVNEPPLVTDIPDQAVAFGDDFATFDLDDYVSDPDNIDADMTWTFSGNTELSVSIDGDHVATITKPSSDWSGSETITFTATDPGGGSDSDPATFSVAVPPAAAHIVLNTDSLFFNGYQSGPDPSAQTIIVTNGGDGDLNWNALASETWVGLSVTSGAAPSGFDVTIEVASLTIGTHTAEISITSAEADNSPQTVYVEVTIVDDVDIALDPDSLFFEALNGNPDPQSFNISNGSPSGIEFDWGAVETTPWMALDQTNGTSPADVAVNIDASALLPGDYDAVIIVKQLSETLGIDDDQDTVYVQLTVDQQTDVDDIGGALPSDYRLSQNFPNPFNPTTVIEFNLPQAGYVTLSVFNVLGQRVTTLVDEALAAGNKRVVWDGTDSSGRTVESGVYFYRITAAEFTQTRKMMLLK